MNLYLVQHGESLAKDVDPVRPLSEQGRQHVRRVAQFAAKSGCVNLTHILHSGKLRARQTAEIFSDSLGISHPVHSDDLAPMDDPAIWAKRCEELAEDTMLVGHLPHLARLAGILLYGDSETEAVNFRMGGIVALRKEEGKWSLQWMVVPDILINP